MVKHATQDCHNDTNGTQVSSHEMRSPIWKGCFRTVVCTTRMALDESWGGLQYDLVIYIYTWVGYEWSWLMVWEPRQSQWKTVVVFVYEFLFFNTMTATPTTPRHSDLVVSSLRCHARGRKWLRGWRSTSSVLSRRSSTSDFDIDTSAIKYRYPTVIGRTRWSLRGFEARIK